MQWKKFAIENLAELFERPNKKSQQQKESESIQGQLLKTIGTQKIELDFLKKVSATVRKRASCIGDTSRQLSVSSQCKLLNISRSAYYYKSSSKQDEKDFELLKQIKAIQLEHPEKGYRKIWREIKRQGGEATEKQIRRVMKRFGLMALFPGKNLSKSCKRHKKYPYLLKIS